jgi:hypothetical protein
MSMKLLPASVGPVDPSQSDVSNSLVPLAQRAIDVQGGQISDVPSAAAFTWSSRNRAAGANWIDATPLEDSESDEARRSAVEYVSGWAWGGSIGRSAIAHYLAYAAGLVGSRGRLVDLYA